MNGGWDDHDDHDDTPLKSGSNSYSKHTLRVD